MKVILIFRNFINKIKELWNVYGGIALSTLISWWSSWSKASMDTWSSYITLTISCIGLLTFFKLVIAKRNKNKADAVALSSNKNVKNIRHALEPDKVGEELGTTLLYTVQEGKKLMSKFSKIMKWLWGNKLTLTSIVSNLILGAIGQFLMYSDTLKDYQFFQEHKTVFIVVVTGLTILWLLHNTYCLVTKYGLESLKELELRSKRILEEQQEKLSPEQRKVLKQQLAIYKNQEAKILEDLLNIENAINKAKSIIDDFTFLKSLGATPTNEQRMSYDDAINTLANAQANKTTLEDSKEKLENQIKLLKERL